MNRRRTDRSDLPHRRREDELEQVVDASQRRNKLLTELLEHGSRNFRRYRRRAYFAFAVLSLSCAYAIYQQDKANDKANEAAIEAKASSARANAAAAQAKALAREIQKQRRESIRTNCESQNRRHDTTIANLDTLIGKLPPGPRRERAKTGRAGTVLLIESLQPHQDCKALVRRSVQTP